MKLSLILPSIIGALAINGVACGRKGNSLKKERALQEPCKTPIQTVKKLEDLFQQKDAERLADLFTTDGMFMHTGSPTITGRDAIKAAFSSSFSMLEFDFEYTEMNEVVKSGTIAVVHAIGSITMPVPGGGGEEQTLHYREVIVLTKSSKLKSCKYGIAIVVSIPNS